MPPVDPWDRFDDRMRALEHRVAIMGEPLENLGVRMAGMETRMITMGEAMARVDESLKHIIKMEPRIEKMQQDLDRAHEVIRHNKLVIDMIRWSVALIVPATLSVFAAFAMEVFTR